MHGFVKLLCLLCLSCVLVHSQSGDVQLSLRDKNGGLSGGFRLHYSDMDLAPPPKRERVLVLSGKDKGKFGVVNVSELFAFMRILFFFTGIDRGVLIIPYFTTNTHTQAVQRRDVFVELDVDPGNPKIFRETRVAWLNTPRN